MGLTKIGSGPSFKNERSLIVIETKKVIKQCKQAEACFNLKMKNFRKKVVNSECKPAAKKGNLTSKLYCEVIFGSRSERAFTGGNIDVDVKFKMFVADLIH